VAVRRRSAGGAVGGDVATKVVGASEVERRQLGEVDEGGAVGGVDPSDDSAEVREFGAEPFEFRVLAAWRRCWLAIVGDPGDGDVAWQEDDVDAGALGGLVG
jgi:hypothetical protein